MIIDTSISDKTSGKFEAVAGSPRILVVDDSVSICFSIATALQREGYEVDVALNGQEALDKVRTFRPHCLILDVVLPDMSGYAVCRHVRKSMSENRGRIILISTKDAPLDVNYGLRQGADRYLPKPFTASTLLQTVRELIPGPKRAAPVTSASTPQVQVKPVLSELIPRRVLGKDALRTRNPFAPSPLARDKQASRLYAVIDGKKTVAQLSVVTRLETKEITRALQVLLKENYIQIYEASGKLVESSKILS